MFRLSPAGEDIDFRRCVPIAEGAKNRILFADDESAPWVLEGRNPGGDAGASEPELSEEVAAYVAPSEKVHELVGDQVGVVAAPPGVLVETGASCEQTIVGPT